VRVVLDAEAVNALLTPTHPGERTVRRAVASAVRLRRDVVIPTVTLAELYRGSGRSRSLDALLAREEPNGLFLRDTDRAFARLVGALLAEASAGSDFLAGAHAVAAAVEVGGGMILTADPDDITRIAAPYRTIAVEGLPGHSRNRRRL
jgi:predicted nucleic acid-binding protein